MNKFRVWHSSRDPYHCVFRMIRLMTAKAAPLTIERLRILDMLLLYPAILYRVSLPDSLKRQLRELPVAKPENSFLRLPSAATVWQELQIYQSAALNHLAGRGLLDRVALANQQARLNDEAVPDELLAAAHSANQEQRSLLTFLRDGLSELPDTGTEGLIRRAHLPARGPVL